MDFETMMKLVNAGFTKDEILKMNPTPQQTTPEPQQTTPEGPEPQQTPAGNENEIIAQLTSQVTDLAKIVKDMQSNNIKNASMEAPKQTTSLDAIKSFFGDTSLNERR